MCSKTWQCWQLCNNGDGVNGARNFKESIGNSYFCLKTHECFQTSCEKQSQIISEGKGEKFKLSHQLILCSLTRRPGYPTHHDLEGVLFACKACHGGYSYRLEVLVFLVFEISSIITKLFLSFPPIPTGWNLRQDGKWEVIFNSGALQNHWYLQR